MIVADVPLGGVYLLMAAMLVLGMLMTRRDAIGRRLTAALAWCAIFGAGFILLAHRDNMGLLAQRLRAEALGTAVVTGLETRIPMAVDGHFWVRAKVNGADVRFLVDSGATMTTIDRSSAERAGVEVSASRDQVVRTGNGLIRVASARVETIAVGGIERTDMRVQVGDSDNLNVLGMNFLSSLKRWGVEGRWLILEP